QITGNDVHHISRVMRNELGDEIICIHPDQTIARCEIRKIESDVIYCSIISIELNQYELPVYATIIQALPKGDKLELIIQKGTELGDSNFIYMNQNVQLSNGINKKHLKK